MHSREPEELGYDMETDRQDGDGPTVHTTGRRKRASSKASAGHSDSGEPGERRLTG